MAKDNKILKQEDLSKAQGGSPGARFIPINFDIECDYCDYVGPMTYEEGTEEESSRFVYAHCPNCKNLKRVALGTK